MDDKLKSKVGEFASTFAQKYDDIVTNNLKKASFDKTFTGFVSEKIERDDGTYRWRIQTNGVAYDIKPEMCNISCVGQRVRLYIPSHSYKDKYAEVIGEDDYKVLKIECDEEEEKITNTIQLPDNSIDTKVYKLTYKNKNTSDEEVSAITLPDGHVLKLNGFYTRK